MSTIQTTFTDTPDQGAVVRRKGLPAWWLFLEDKILLNVATLMMLAAMGFMFYEAVSRTAIAQSHLWAEELVRFLVVWSVLLSLGTASRRGHYIRMDMLVAKAPRVVRLALAWLNALMGLGFSVLLLIAGIHEVSHLYAIGMLTESTLDLPLWQVRLIMPISGVLFGLYFAGNAVMLIRGEEPDPSIAH